MKGNSGFQIGTGVTSILMIFVVLCLTTFGILSYTSADADLKLSRNYTDYIESYYDTYSKLNDELAKMDGIVYRKMYEEGVSDSALILSALEENQTKDIKATYTLNNESIDVVLSKTINDNQELVMEICFNTSGTDKRCKVKKCYVYSENGNVTQEETLPEMWGG